MEHCATKCSHKKSTALSSRRRLTLIRSGGVGMLSRCSAEGDISDFEQKVGVVQLDVQRRF
jgi:hypothetical protein